MTPSDSNLPRRALWWTFAAISLSLAVLDNGGRYSPLGLFYLTLAIGLAIAGTFAPRLTLELDLNRVLAAGCVLFAALGLQAVADLRGAIWFAACLLFAGVLALAIAFFARRGLGKILFPLFLVAQLGLGLSTLQSARDFEASGKLKFGVSNDVQIFSSEAARLLLAGQNPYSARMPNVMGADFPYYPPNVTVGGRLPFGYPYMPLSALWILPGQLAGDLRLMHLVALLGTAWFLASARPSPTSKLAATLFLLFPASTFVLQMSWTEPVALFFLAATLWCYFRAPKWLPLALGCLICAKQYTVFLLPLLPLLVPERAKMWPLIGKSLAVALVLTLPMALWDVDGFSRSAVLMQFKQPFRADSLSYLVAVLNATGRQLSPILGFAALLGGLFFGLRAAKTPSHWVAAGAVAYLGFFALNKQAFANYYFWVFGLLLAAVAVALPPSADHEKIR